MSSIKQLIVNAIMKVSESNPAFDREDGPTAEEARDNFIKLLLAELFPEDPSVPAAPVVVAEASPGRKKRAPMTEEAKAAMKAKRDATLAAKKSGVESPDSKKPEVVESPESKKPESPETSPGRKKRAPMTEEAKAAMKAKREATLAAKKSVSPPEPAAVETTGSNAAAGGVPAPVKARKPKAPEDANLAKIDPTWRKHLKHADKDHAKELEPQLLAYLNGLSKDEFNAKKAEEHVAEFLASRKPADDGKVDAELVVVEFNGKEYYVNPETKRVYEGEGTCDEDGQWTNYKPVGYVGMAAFADMTVDE